MINILCRYFGSLAHVAASSGLGNGGSPNGFAIGLTKEGLIIAGIVILALVVAAFFVGKNARGAFANTEDDETEVPSSDLRVSGGKSQDDSELVAVITAAIMAMRSEEAKAEGKAPVGFKVVSFNRTDRR